MNIDLIRREFTKFSTIGDFIIDGEWFCFTLEDMVREPGVKIPGKTAIPEGRYRVMVDQSNRFKRAMPHILDVPGFDGIRIHNGNYPRDTEGCVLLGFTKSKDFVGDSKSAFNKFFDKLYMALRDEECWITIEGKVGDGN
jgi:hypothetical protein